MNLSTDIPDLVQPDFNFIEKLLSLYTLKNKTRNIDFFNAFKEE